MRQTSRPDHVEEWYPTACPDCGACSRCGRLVRATFPPGVVGPVQFGPNLSAIVVDLRVKQLIPERRVTEILEKFLGIEMSPATVATICRRKAQEHRQIAEAWERQVAQGEATKSRDETGFRVEVQTQWLHVMSTENRPSCVSPRVAVTCSTVWQGESGTIMLRLISKEDLPHGYCQIHQLRESRAVQEQQGEWAEKMPWYLLVLERFVRRSKRRDLMLQNRGSPEITEDLKAKIYRRYDDILGAAYQDYEGLPLGQSGKRGRRKKRPGHNLAERLRKKREDLLRFVLHWAIPFTDNLVERDLRMMKRCLKISGGFRSQRDADDFAVLRRLGSTAEKQRWDVLSTLRLSTGELADKLMAE